MTGRASMLRGALEAEDAWQRRELAASRSRPWAEQVALGVAWPEVRVEEARPGRRGRWVWMVRARGALPESPGPGDAVEVMPAGAQDGRWRGFVRSVEEAVAELEVEAEPPDRARVALRYDARTHERQRQALSAVDSRQGALAAFLRGEAAWAAPAPWEGTLDEGLGERQRAVLAGALGARELGLILFGPPGTGKTHVVVAGLKALVRAGERPWALADSNAAVDHLTVTAAGAGLNVVRLGSPARVGAAAVAWSLETRMRGHAVAPAVAVIDRELRRAPAGREGAARRRELFAERDRLLDLARAEVVGGAEVLAMTLGTLAREAARLPPARTAVIDEATQATEPATWVAAAWAERLILAGDPHQLGPVVLQPGNPLGESLLQRLLREHGGRLAEAMLDEQRRMAPGLQELVRPVYGPGYRAHPSRAGSVGRLTWVDTSGAGLEEERDAVSGSWRNRGEVAVVAGAVARWRAEGWAEQDIGVIAPYSAQVGALRARPELAGVEVSTVNGFQGREKRAVAVSFVRSNAEGALGFAVDRRRLTVALTRARDELLLIGDLSTLGTAPWVAEVADLVAAQGWLRTVWEEPWSEALDQ